MEYEFDDMLGISSLGLDYEAHVEGFDGECFHYSVYFENDPTEEDEIKVSEALSSFLEPYNEKDIYLGYIDTSLEDDRVNIELDLGNVDQKYENTAIHGILNALNGVSGLVKVIVNEGCDF